MSETPPEEGTVLTTARTFTTDDVRQFADLSHDRGTHHEETDEEGRLVVHGLLTATLPTEIGGELNVMARSMEFGFHRPVFTGEEITCEVTLDAVVEREDRHDVTADIVCRNEDDETVLTGDFDGVVFK